MVQSGHIYQNHKIVEYLPNLQNLYPKKVEARHKEESSDVNCSPVGLGWLRLSQGAVEGAIDTLRFRDRFLVDTL